MLARFVGLWSVTWLAAAAVLPAQDVGPANGALVIVGGRDAPIVVIPTAGGAESYDQSWAGLSGFKTLGVSNLTVLHTYDRTIADTEAFAEPIRKARGVWFPGGRQWRLADSYLHTTVHTELQALLSRGGVIGGTSAGATIQGAYLVRGDTKGNELMMGDHEKGMGFLRNSAIDQHLLRRNRQFDLIDVIERRPDLLGIGIDENTAIVVRGDEFEVIGASYVAIFDHARRLDSGGQFYLLAPGDVFDLKSRTAYRSGRERRELERVVKQPWR